MNNSVNTQLAGHVFINNPTCYHPDTIIGKYLAERGETVVSALNSRIQSGCTLETAAQDLFTRAVRNEEYKSHKNFMFYMILFVEGINILSDKGNLIQLALKFGGRVGLDYLAAYVNYYLFDFISTRMFGRAPHHSI